MIDRQTVILGVCGGFTQIDCCVYFSDTTRQKRQQRGTAGFSHDLL